MLTTGSEFATTDADISESTGLEAGSKFYPIMGENISIQAIVEGSLLAEIELDPIPEYGIQL